MAVLVPKWLRLPCMMQNQRLRIHGKLQAFLTLETYSWSMLDVKSLKSKEGV